MDFWSLKPTDENIMNTFKEDLISRNRDVLHMASLVQNMDGGASIALDAKWGAGKTFFVKQLKMVLDAYNGYTTILSDSDKQDVKTLCDKYKIIDKLDPMVTVYYDAWANDNDIDPILSIVYSTVCEANDDFQLKKGTDYKSIAGSIFELLTDRDLNSLINSLKGEEPLVKIKEAKDIQNNISEFLLSMLPERGNKLVVIIDELDRCRPSYAVQLLERIKHYFDCDNIIFVFSVNLLELQHTIKQYYGNEFNAAKYLDKFFDMIVSLPQADISAYYQTIGLENESLTVKSVYKSVVKSFNLELREISHFFYLTKAATNMFHKIGVGFSNNPLFDALQFSAYCIVPIIIGLRISSMSEYKSFIEGNNPEPLVRVLKSTGDIAILCNHLLGEGVMQLTSENEEANWYEEEVDLDTKLQQVYEALFVADYDIVSHINVGSISFNKGVKQEVLRIADGLFADFSLK